MKKTLLSLALISACGTATATELYNGRLSGMSGAGYVTSGYVDGVLLNPSLAAAYGEKDDFAVVTNFGLLGSDKDGVIKGIDDLMDHVDYLNEANIQDLSQADADKLINLLEGVDSKSVDVTFGGSIVIAIPNDMISIAIISKGSGAATIMADVADEDYEAIENAINAPFDPDDLVSTGAAQGAILTEVGIALAKTVAEAEDHKIMVGITPKRVLAETFIYSDQIANYDTDDFDGDNYTEDSSATSMDAGVTYISGKTRYGLTIENLMSKDFKTVDPDTKFELSRKATAAIGYTGNWFTAEAALDLTSAEVFGIQGDSKMLRAGIELRPFSWLQLRGGMQRDTEDTLADTYSVGLGISPFDLINLDLAAFTGKGDTMGGAVQLGLRF